MPLALTNAQLAQVMQIAGPIRPDLRGQFLVLVARSLAGRVIDDGSVYRAARDAAKSVMWNMDREAS